MSPSQIVSELSVDNIRNHVRHIVATMPSRLAGSPNAARMAEYSAAQLQAAGVAARIENIPGLVSFPREAELVVVAPEQRMLAANTLGHSPQTLPEGVCGDLVYVGSLCRFWPIFRLRGKGRRRKDHAVGIVVFPRTA